MSEEERERLTDKNWIYPEGDSELQRRNESVEESKRVSEGHENDDNVDRNV